jgi:hypothetical protein
MNHSISKFILSLLIAATISLSAISASRDYYQIQVFKLSGKTQQEKVEDFL